MTNKCPYSKNAQRRTGKHKKKQPVITGKYRTLVVGFQSDELKRLPVVRPLLLLKPKLLSFIPCSYCKTGDILQTTMHQGINRLGLHLTTSHKVSSWGLSIRTTYGMHNRTIGSFRQHPFMQDESKVACVMDYCDFATSAGGSKFKNAARSDQEFEAVQKRGNREGRVPVERPLNKPPLPSFFRCILCANDEGITDSQHESLGRIILHYITSYKVPSWGLSSKNTYGMHSATMEHRRANPLIQMGSAWACGVPGCPFLLKTDSRRDSLYNQHFMVHHIQQEKSIREIFLELKAHMHNVFSYDFDKDEFRRTLTMHVNTLADVNEGVYNEQLRALDADDDVQEDEKATDWSGIKKDYWFMETQLSWYQSLDKKYL
ncbi:hypothetical protein [Absidia glauca]|uniref:Uncharacterized protein n=1 Tax=Absidia glauca TaxID=4829 RepID=A0A163MS77_ABSGL|nr:hypothetical protein [Absidia glauca]